LFAPAKNLNLAAGQIPYKPFQPKLGSDAFRESSAPDSLNSAFNDYRNLRHRTHPLRILNYFCINQRLRFSKIAKTIRRASSFQSPRLADSVGDLQHHYYFITKDTSKLSRHGEFISVFSLLLWFP
jgi:hypothetical protein